MKQRIISGLIGTIFVVLMLFLRNTIVFNVIIALAIVVALYEALVDTKYIKSFALFLISTVFAITVPFFQVLGSQRIGVTITYAYLLLTLVIMLFSKNKITLREVSYVIMMSLIIPFSLSTLVYLNVAETDGLFLLLTALGGAWMGDTGAYFIGNKFGRHKLAPDISPKKTIEGAVGSVFATALFFIILSFIWELAVLKDAGKVQYLYMILTGIVCSIVGMLGDLVFSYIKRSCNIKDFGKIIPGHGGVLDRVDSLIFTAPLVYLIVEYIPLIVRK